jgi:hypothetical protein
MCATRSFGTDAVTLTHTREPKEEDWRTENERRGGKFLWCQVFSPLFAED